VSIKFRIEKQLDQPCFSLVYHEEDYAFDAEPFYGGGETSILINFLQLEIDYDGTILYVWGYCPLIEYKETDEFPKNYQTYDLVAILDKPPIPGISYRINNVNEEWWPIFINKKKGWVCLGNPLPNEKQQMVEFAPNCVAALENQEITAVWLKPKSLPELPESAKL
jgi:hypothetical protein